MCKCGCGGVTTPGRIYIAGHNMRKWAHSHKSPEYQSWNSMIQRCYGKGDIRYRNGGIKVCRRWRESFDRFFEDMGARPSIKHSIDRIDGEGNYTPSNCRWATKVEQNLNRSDNRWVIHKGERIVVTHLAKKFNMTQGKLQKRLKKGMTLKEALDAETK